MSRYPDVPNQNEKLTLTCSKCGKTYRIRKAKIPAGATAVRCKACGQRVRLEGRTAAKPSFYRPAGSPSAADGIVGKPALSPPRARLDLMTEEKRRRPYRKHRSRKPRPL
jgi:predicted Zn finger-like uncharacterized protein